MELVGSQVCHGVTHRLRYVISVLLLVLLLFDLASECSTQHLFLQHVLVTPRYIQLLCTGSLVFVNHLLSHVYRCLLDQMDLG